MRDKFPGFYPPADFNQLWQNATFVLDTNVLLNLYRYPKTAREQLLATFDKISNRLFVPFQAALEYQRNRLAVIQEQKKRFSALRSKLSSIPGMLESELKSAMP